MIGSMLMITGIAVLALMTGVLATGFAQEERRREYLRVWEQVARVPMFASLGVVTLSEIVGKLRTRYYPPRITVVRRGEPGDSMFFISERRGRGPPAQRRRGAAGRRRRSSARWRCSNASRAAPTVATTQPTTLLVLYASDFYEIASHIPSLAEAVEVEARRRREENLGRQSGRRHDRRQERHRFGGRHRPLARPSPSAISRRVPRPAAARGLLATKALAMSLDHARHPGWRLRQAPVAPVAREHAQAVRAAAGQAVDLPADAGARRRPEPVRAGR